MATDTTSTQEDTSEGVEEQASSTTTDEVIYTTMSEDWSAATNAADKAQSAASSLQFLFTTGTFIITGIHSSTTNGFIVAPLVWQKTSFSGGAVQVVSMLEDGEIALWVVQTTDNRAEYNFTAEGGDGIFRYWYAATHSDADVATVSTIYDTSTNPSPGTITYSSSEAEQLRDLFGQPANSTILSQIKVGIKNVATAISTMDLDVRFKSEGVKTQPFTADELTLLAGDETDQGVSLTLTTTKTGDSTSTQVESTSTFTTRGGY